MKADSNNEVATPVAAPARTIGVLVEQVVAQCGLRVYKLDVSGSPRRPFIRLRLKRSGGAVSVDDCAFVSNQLTAQLNLESALGLENYTLEVSSPGADRELDIPGELSEVVGQAVAVKTRVDGVVATHAGKLVAFDEVRRTLRLQALVAKGDRGRKSKAAVVAAEEEIPLDIVFQVKLYVTI